jgi:hypothetical protein
VETKESNRPRLVIPEISTGVVPVSALLNPFEREVVKAEVLEGSSIADILRGMGLPAGMPARIFVDGHMVAADEREELRPRKGQFVTIRVQLEGGGGSGNKMAMIGIQLLAVVAAAATFYAGGVGGIAVEGVTIPGAVLAASAFSATTLVGTLAVNARIPPPALKTNIAAPLLGDAGPSAPVWSQL